MLLSCPLTDCLAKYIHISVNEDVFHICKDESSSEVDDNLSDSDFSLSEDDSEDDSEEDEEEPKEGKAGVVQKRRTVSTASNELKDHEADETKLPVTEPGTVSSSDGMVGLDLIGHFIIH